MKIQKLVIHNIASFEDAEIDFSKAPLADSDVFLITGETGSGKSTILDAICLALYKSTPRLENTRMQGAVADAGKDVQISEAYSEGCLKVPAKKRYIDPLIRGQGRASSLSEAFRNDVSRFMNEDYDVYLKGEYDE